MHGRYGDWSRCLINRDSTLLALVGTGISRTEPDFVATTCCNPLGKRRPLVADSPQLRYAAATTVCALGAKLSDDAEDERGWKALAARTLGGLLSEPVNRAMKTLAEWDFPVLEVEQHLARQSRAEAEGQGLDAASHATEFAYERIFGHLPQVVECETSFATPLRDLGRNLGKMIYADDAWRDFDRDRKEGRFNPLPQDLGARRQVLGDVFQSALSSVSQAIAGLRFQRGGELVQSLLLGALPKQAEARYANKLRYGVKRPSDGEPKNKRQGWCSSGPCSGLDCDGCGECCPCDCDCCDCQGTHCGHGGCDSCHGCDCHGCDCSGCDCGGCDCSCH